MMLERDVDPTVYRRRLRNILRRTREKLEITQAHAAREMSWSVSKLIRIETGTVTISVNDLKVLLPFYGITDEKAVTDLIEMAKNSRPRIPGSTLGWALTKMSQATSSLHSSGMRMPLSVATVSSLF
jgi:transcriptional regulator with XRE-family HTH domain